MYHSELVACEERGSGHVTLTVTVTAMGMPCRHPSPSPARVFVSYLAHEALNLSQLNLCMLACPAWVSIN